MILKGKTQKGKNVVQRDGAEWRIERADPSVACFDGRPGLFIVPVGHVEPSRATRWIEPNNDEHFEIEGEA